MMEILSAQPENIDDLERYCEDARKLGATGATRITMRMGEISATADVQTAKEEPS